MNKDFIFELEHLKGWSKTDLKKLKRLIQSDTFFTANQILRAPQHQPLREIHQEICNQFPKPNPDKPLSEWSPIKSSVVLAFRGCLKTTLLSVFLLQVLLCAPNVRIQLLSGTKPLARQIMGMVLGYFRNPVIQALFPDFSVPELSETADSFTLSNRTVASREPTMSVDTFRTSKPGPHCDILVLDDATNSQNCANARMVETTNGRFNQLYPLVVKGGYTIFLGTRWAMGDVPQVMKDDAESILRRTGVQTLRWFELPVWRVKKGKTDAERAAIESRRRRGTLEPSDVIWTWPENIDPLLLFQKYRNHPSMFAHQYLLSPTLPKGEARFTRELLKSCLGSKDVCPCLQESVVVMAIDLANAGVDGRDKTAIAVGLAHGLTPGLPYGGQHLPKYFFLGGHLKKYTDEKTEIQDIAAIFHLYAEASPWKVKLRIENANQARAHMDEKFKELGVEVEWQYPQSIKDARLAAYIQLSEGMYLGDVQFLDEARCGDELEKQLLGYRPDQKRASDDLLDALARAGQYARTVTFEKKPDLKVHRVPFHEEDRREQEQEQARLEAESNRPEDIADIEWLRAQTVGYGHYGSKKVEPDKRHWTDF